jgi:hypothetical protein
MRCPSCKEDFKKFFENNPYDLHCPLCNCPGILSDFLTLVWEPEAKKILAMFINGIHSDLSEWVEVLAGKEGKTTVTKDIVRELVGRYPNERFKEGL